MFDTFKIKVEGHSWEWDEFKSEVIEFDNGENAFQVVLHWEWDQDDKNYSWKTSIEWCGWNDE